MQPQSRNLIVAAVAGVLVGAGATAVLMSSYAERLGLPAPERGRSTASVAAGPGPPGVDPDDVVAVLDADRPVAAHPMSAAPRAPGPAGARPVDPAVPRLTAGPGEAIDDLRGRRLTLPVQGIAPSKIVQSFDDQRSGSRAHQAIDILAPRHTPVLAVEDGKIARLFISKAGGITLYQYDPSGKYVYYYAHLEGYVDGLKEDAPLRRGQVIGFVGTSGNAPPNTPHLHFAIFEMSDPGRWWEGTPIDPFLVLR